MAPPLVAFMIPEDLVLHVAKIHRDHETGRRMARGRAFS